MVTTLLSWWCVIYACIAFIVAVGLIADDALRYMAHAKVNPLRSFLIAVLWFPIVCVIGVVLFSLWRGGKKNATT